MSRRETVFISYAREDSRWAQAIAKALREADVNVWLDAEIEAGEPWQDLLRGALDKATTVLVIVSSKALASRWVQFEAGAALSAAETTGKRVVPIYLSHKGEDYFPLLRGIPGLNVAGLRPNEAGERVTEFIGTGS